MVTKFGSVKLEKVRQQMRYEGCLTIDAIGIKGGLAMLWKYEN